MSTNKKYDYRIVQKKSDWTAEITRRVTSKKTTVSKSQDGFATEAEAKAWGKIELASFLENLTKRNKREFADHIKNKEEKALREEVNKQRKKDLEDAAAENSDSENSDPEGLD
jgi:Protein of unknown function (DUF3622)